MDNNRKNSVMENIAITRVSKADRKSWLDVMLVQMGCMICVPSLMTGALLIGAMTIADAIIAAIIGCLIICIMISVVGFIGCDIGVPTVIISKSTFGEQGARIFISLIWAVTAIGWFAVQCEECGQAFTNLMVSNFGIDLPVWLSITVWGIVMLLTAVFGFNAMEKLNLVATPLLLIASAVGIIMAISAFGTSGIENHTVDPKNSMSMIEGVGLVVSLGAFAACSAPDFTRYQKNRKQTVISNSVGIGGIGFVMIILGALLTVIAGEYDISAVFITVGMPIIGVIALILATWTTNTANAYSGGLDFVALFKAKDNKRGVATAIAGVISIIATLTGIASDFIGVLNVLGCLTLPATGAVIADYYVIRKGDPRNWRYIKGWRLSGFIATAIGVAVTFIPVGIGMLNGLIASLVTMIIFVKLENAVRKTPIEEIRTEYEDRDIDEYYKD